MPSPTAPTTTALDIADHAPAVEGKPYDPSQESHSRRLRRLVELERHLAALAQRAEHGMGTGPMAAVVAKRIGIAPPPARSWRKGPVLIALAIAAGIGLLLGALVWIGRL